MKAIPDSVRVINIAGEPLHNHLVQQLYEQTNVRRVFNAYGPSEDTTYSTYAHIREGDDETPPIGRPITNTQAYVLDRDFSPVPIGGAGELYLGGAGLARGYLGRPDLTAERFVPNPFAGYGERLYRTGDLARWRPDGQLEYLGRIDHQVKVRGFRIELGEIEAALRTQASVHDAVVLAREEGPWDKRLVAYVVGVDQAAPSANALREHLKRILPDYMLPAAFVLLEALPLTPNGKIDRRALLPLQQQLGEVSAYVAPRTPVEEAVAQIWAQVLRVERVGVHDDFFELGGHSLAAVRVIARMQRELSRDLSLSELFRHSTIDALREQLHDSKGGSVGPRSVLLKPGAGRKPLYFVHPPSGSLYCYRQLIRNLRYDGPLYGLEGAENPGPDALASSIQDMALIYADAISELQTEGTIDLAGWSLGGLIAYELAQQLVMRARDVGMLYLLDTAMPGPVAKPVEVTEALLAREFMLGVVLTHADDTYRRLERIQSIPYQGFKDLVRRSLDEGLLQGIGASEDLTTLSLRFETFKKSVLISLAYDPAPYKGVVTLVQPHQGSSTECNDRAARLKNLVHGSLTVKKAPGNHYTMLTEPHVIELSRLLE